MRTLWPADCNIFCMRHTALHEPEADAHRSPAARLAATLERASQALAPHSERLVWSRARTTPARCPTCTRATGASRFQCGELRMVSYIILIERSPPVVSSSRCCESATREVLHARWKVATRCEHRRVARSYARAVTAARDRRGGPGSSSACVFATTCRASPRPPTSSSRCDDPQTSPNTRRRPSRTAPSLTASTSSVTRKPSTPNTFAALSSNTISNVASRSRHDVTPP